jgi:putative hydrolase of the HAD superfamily
LSIRGLIFDYGGVIQDMGWDIARELEGKYGLEPGTLPRTLYLSDEWRELQLGRGRIRAWLESAHQRLEAAAGKSLPLLHQQWLGSMSLIQENVDLIRSLRPPYRIAILSNADARLEERLRDRPGIGHLFDAVVSSAVVGIAKPDHRVYRLTADRLGLPIQECLFIDDAEPNVTAAREVGMEAIHYRLDQGDDLAAQLAELEVSPTNLSE